MPSSNHQPFIWSNSPAYRPLETNTPGRGNPIPNQYRPRRTIYYHDFYFPVSRGARTLHSDILHLSTARTYIRGAEGQTGRNCLAELPPSSCLTHLYVWIATDLPCRDDALGLVSHRLAILVEMIGGREDWFPGLPYLHHNFEVRLIEPTSGSAEA
jgi:hypothetical protein